ncbi:DMT family transporter [Bacillus toyonensis]|uniref:EamA family transporter n=1 Tax=Bacillus toyonensis TaxID=155322 RepID=A0AB73QS38_9BACI|nr:DMT family transporter [Bacillus toyonensis]PEI82322.1 EamA family transporter [Bacillus toyonensis]PEM40139.1 EamA family transporter [Bacillus toyonensis]PGB58737.1 EamA family transporter [Bacillus toyonensis]
MGKVFTKSTCALLLLVFLWGGSWPIYKMAVPYTPPLLFAGMRAVIGGLILAVLIYKKRNRIKWRENWSKYCISAFFNTILFFGLQTVGLIYLPGGLFSVLVYFQPVLLGLFAWIWLGEYMSPFKIMGLIIGFFGIVVVSVDGVIVHVSIIGVVLGLLMAFSWAVGVVYVKKVSNEVDAFWMVSLQCIIGGVILISTGTIVENWSAIEWNGKYLFGLGYGSTFGIPLAYVIYYKLINAGEASKVGTFTFLVPIIAVFIGTVFLDEPVTYRLVIGLLLVGVSIYFVNYREKKVNVSLFNKSQAKFNTEDSKRKF